MTAEGTARSPPSSPSLRAKAKQSRIPPGRQSGLLRRVAPRNDGLETQQLPSRDAIRARALLIIPPSSYRGRREGRELAAPMARLQKKSRRQSPQVWPDIPAFPARLVLTAYTRSPRGPALLPPSPLRSSQHGLGISTGMPGPHDFAVRVSPFVGEVRLRCALPRPSHSVAYVRDDRDTPLRRNGTGTP
jgi:hypothetical protein